MLDSSYTLEFAFNRREDFERFLADLLALLEDIRLRGEGDTQKAFYTLLEEPNHAAQVEVILSQLGKDLDLPYKAVHDASVFLDYDFIGQRATIELLSFVVEGIGKPVIEKDCRRNTFTVVIEDIHYLDFYDPLIKPWVQSGFGQIKQKLVEFW